MPTYFIRVRGHLPDRYAVWFDGLGIARAPTGETVIAGELPDQGALFGVLLKIRDLGLPLLAVTCESGEPLPDITDVQPAREKQSSTEPDSEGRDDLWCARLRVRQWPLATWQIASLARLLADDLRPMIREIRSSIRLPATGPMLLAYA